MAAEAIGAGTRFEDLDITGVMQVIPHRFPMLMIDRLTEIEAHHRAVGIKLVSVNEPYFQGHFPNDPIMPGVFVIEAMAQSAAALIMKSLGGAHEGRRVYFMSLDETRFRRPVRPGDELRLEVVVQRAKLMVWKFKGIGTVRGETAAEATFMAKMMEW